MLIDNIKDFDKDFILEQLKSINKSAQSAYDLLEDLLLWSRSQSGNINFEIQDVNVFEIVEEMLQDFNLRCAKKEINLINECETKTIVEADLNMLRTILRNLLSNAIKFTPNGSEVKINSEKINEKVKISVIDSGVGISDNNIKKILAANELFSTYGTNNEKGTGLGLKICKQFIKNHNSELEIESEVGKGSEFSFMLEVSKS
jgi:two-component system sensor histidine kinase/response regulator